MVVISSVRMEPTGMQNPIRRERAGAITWRVMNFSTTEPDGQGIGRARILSAIYLAKPAVEEEENRKRVRGGTIWGMDCLVHRLVAVARYLQRAGVREAKWFREMFGNYPAGTQLACVCKR